MLDPFDPQNEHLSTGALTPAEMVERVRAEETHRFLEFGNPRVLGALVSTPVGVATLIDIVKKQAIVQLEDGRLTIFLETEVYPI